MTALGILIIVATLLGLRSIYMLEQDRRAEIATGREDGTTPWLLTLIVRVCSGCLLVGLWLSVLAAARLLGSPFEWAAPVSYAIGLIVVALPTYLAWEFRRRVRV